MQLFKTCSTYLAKKQSKQWLEWQTECLFLIHSCLALYNHNNLFTRETLWCPLNCPSRISFRSAIFFAERWAWLSSVHCLFFFFLKRQVDSSKARVWEKMKETCLETCQTAVQRGHLARMLVIAFVVDVASMTVTLPCTYTVSGPSSPLHQGVTERTGRTRRRPTWKVSVCVQYPYCSERGLSLMSRNDQKK